MCNEFIVNSYDSLATGFICKYIECGNNNLRRQDIQGFFHDDGKIYVIKTVFTGKGSFYGKKIGRKVISRWRNIEIDDEFDCWLTKNIDGRYL
jgi:CMP-N-acetylneuraminic acid synthetase|tara:strand:- start:597 stop:875 length:279 start_codon:yes stop_codon:yes gene_type:complete